MQVLYSLIEDGLKTEVIQDSTILVHAVGSVDPELVLFAPLFKVMHLFHKLLASLLSQHVKCVYTYQI